MSPPMPANASPSPFDAAIPFDAFTLAAVAAELRDHFLPARVQKVQQPNANDLILGMYGKGGAFRLLLSADPQRYRVHITQQRRENPPTPPGFCQVCRKYLEGAICQSIVLPHFDRVAYLDFRAHDGERVRLVAELMGRNANVVLVSGANVVRGSLRPVPADNPRSLRPNSVYTDPPGFSDHRDPLTVTASDDPVFANLPEDTGEQTAFLANTFSGIGRFGAAEIAARASHGLPHALVAQMDAVRANDFAPYSIQDSAGRTRGVWAFEPLSVPVDRRFRRESISVALDTFHAALAEGVVETSEQAQLKRSLQTEIAYRVKEIASSRRTIEEARRADEYEQMGNNLLASMGRWARGATTATVPDLYGPTDAEVTIALDPQRSPQANTESYFERARKARDAAEYADGRVADLEDELERLRVLQLRAESETDASLIARLRMEFTEIVGERRAGAASATPRRDGKAFGGHKIRRFEVAGYELLIGESAQANDYLTTRVAASTDYWLHVRSAPGAHGVLRTQGQPQRVPDPVLRRAAEIVAARSGNAIKHASVVAVDVVEKRYVRKPRGAQPGMVTYQRERVLDVLPKA